MPQLASKSKREKGQYKPLPLIHGQVPGQVNADKSGSAQIPQNFKSKISKREANPRPSELIRGRAFAFLEGHPA